MDMKLNHKMRKGKKGVSTVVITVIMVALVIGITIAVWTVINNLVKGKMASTESCFGNFGKITLNEFYTCYNNTGVYFSINIADIDLDSAIVSISGAAETKSFEITNTAQQITNLANYGSGGFGTDWIKLPGKNEGKSYITNFLTSKPDFIKIAPVINGQQCDASDTLSEIEYC